MPPQEPGFGCGPREQLAQSADSGSRNGSGRSSTEFTTLKMVVLAAIASMTVNTTVAVNRGARRMMRAV
jgi:hypothetical protein